jgi:hypothetical protein
VLLSGGLEDGKSCNRCTHLIAQCSVRSGSQGWGFFFSLCHSPFFGGLLRGTSRANFSKLVETLDHVMLTKAGPDAPERPRNFQMARHSTKRHELLLSNPQHLRIAYDGNRSIVEVCLKDAALSILLSQCFPPPRCDGRCLAASSVSNRSSQRRDRLPLPSTLWKPHLNAQI